MFGSAIFDVMVGLIFIYILLSLLVAQINTVIANTLNIRAKLLRKRLERILLDSEIQKKVLAHPVISLIMPPRNTNKSEFEISAEEMRTANINKIHAASFTKSLINVLSDPFLNLYAALGMVRDTRERRQLQSIVTQLQTSFTDEDRASALLSRLHESISQFQPEDRPDRRALLQTLGPLQSAIRNQTEQNPKLLMILNGVTRVENPAFRQAMETILSGVGSVKEAEIAIDTWFNDKMSQTSDWYSVLMGYFSLFVGLALAILFNIDTVHMSLTLWNNDALRQVIAQTARTADLSAYFDEDGNLILPTDEQVAEGEVDSIEAVLASYAAAQSTLNQLLELRLPIGWTYRTPASVSPPEAQDGSTLMAYDPLEDPRNLYRLFAVGEEGWLGFTLGKISGILITAMSTAQGAPFWFDILRRLTGNESPSVQRGED